MIALDENALICDFAETYHIFDFRALPVKLAATLASGLGENSRIKIKARKEKAPRETVLLSVIADRMALLMYMLGGGKGKMPDMLTDLFIEQETNKTDKPETYATGADFLAAWNEE